MLMLLTMLQALQADIGRISPADWTSPISAERNADLSLSTRSFLAFTPTGDIAVVDDSRERILIVSPRTRGIRTIGRTGSGPGEFRHIGAFGWRRDTLWAADDRNARLTFFPSADARRARAVRFLTISDGTSFMNQPLGLISEDRAIGYLQWMRRRALGEILPPIPVIVVSRSGFPRTWDTIATLQSENRSYTIPLENGNIVGQQPMSDATLWSVSRNGEYFATLERDDKRLTREKSMLLTVHHLPTTKQRRLVIPVALERTTAQDVNRFVENLTDTPRRIARVRAETVRRILFTPFWRAPVTELIVENDGRLLLRGNDWSSPWVRYTLLDSTGKTVRQFQVERSVTIRSFRGDQLLAVREHPDGEVDLVIARLAAR